ncbi:MAG TPA: hypothetical protein VGT07_17065 [Steroidobacteraceae bacterium]|nr:hypothetical protein [Steroidobacteraceae bacterium]
MSTETNDTDERLRFRERYRTMANDDLARLALYEDLMPAAREAITEELETRGLRDLSSFRKQFEEDAILARAEGLSAFTPVSLRPPAQKDRNQQLLGLTIFAVWGLVGVHWWLLGAATTWRREATIGMCLFSGLVLTWDPMVSVLKGRASRKLVFWLVLVSLQFAVLIGFLAVPTLVKFASIFNPLQLAILFSPLFVLGVYGAVTRFASRRR